jgi:hypothetical protein
VSPLVESSNSAVRRVETAKDAVGLGRQSGEIRDPDDADGVPDPKAPAVPVLRRRDLFCAPPVHPRAARDDRTDLDFVVVLDHFAVGQELVAADYHGGARKDAELGE